MSFQSALNFVLENEGGLTNDPEDHGGLTNFGIIKDDLAEYRKVDVSEITDDDIKNLTVETVSPIYKQFYWDKLSLDYVKDSALSTILFDIGVNRGIGAAAKDLQRAVGVTVDGVIGQGTLAAVANLNARNITKRVIQYDIRAYANIVKNNPTQSVFILGWMNRATSYLDFI